MDGILTVKGPAPIASSHQDGSSHAVQGGPEALVCGGEIHEAANLLPKLAEAEFELLKHDIKKRGLLHPIVIDRGNRIVDGRHRFWACKAEGVEPNYERYNGADDERAVYEFVIERNLRRRHLTETQRALGAAETACKFATNSGQAVINEEAARWVVSARSANAAKAVLALQCPILTEAVRQGVVPVSVAEKLRKVERTRLDDLNRALAEIRDGDPERKKAQVREFIRAAIAAAPAKAPASTIRTAHSTDRKVEALLTKLRSLDHQGLLAFHSCFEDFWNDYSNNPSAVDASTQNLE
jgi:hypothetical protein